MSTNIVLECLFKTISCLDSGGLEVPPNPKIMAPNTNEKDCFINFSSLQGCTVGGTLFVAIMVANLYMF